MQATTLVPRTEPSQCFRLLEGHTPLDTSWLLGTQVIGSNVSWLLLGFLATQTYTYYTQSAKDHPMLKIFVYSLVFLSGFGETAAEGYDAYVYLVSGRGNPDAEIDNFLPLIIQLDLQPVFAAISAIAVQLFFTWRIWKFCQAVWGRRIQRFVAALCLMIVLMSISAFASAIVLFVYELAASEPNDLLDTTTILLWSISTAVVDVTITICLMVILYRAKSSAYYGETRDKLSHMLRLTIQTGFLTSILAIPVAPLFVFTPGLDAITMFLIGKSYVITLLVNLNARTSYQPKLEPTTGDDTPNIPTIAFMPGQTPATSRANTTSSNHVVAVIRSATRTVRHALTASRAEDREPQSVNGGTVATDRQDADGQVHSL